MESQYVLKEQPIWLIRQRVNFCLKHGSLDLAYSIILLIHQIRDLTISGSFPLNLFLNNLLIIISFQFHLIDSRTLL